MALHAKNHYKHGNFALDPTVDKERIEEGIARAIEEQIQNLDDSEVLAAVKDKYEKLLAGAKIKQHVPTLTEGVVKSEFRHQRIQKGKRRPGETGYAIFPY